MLYSEMKLPPALCDEMNFGWDTFQNIGVNKNVYKSIYRFEISLEFTKSPLARKKQKNNLRPGNDRRFLENLDWLWKFNSFLLKLVKHQLYFHHNMALNTVLSQTFYK
jgi:hypothetical protein